MKTVDFLITLYMFIENLHNITGFKFTTKRCEMSIPNMPYMLDHNTYDSRRYNQTLMYFGYLHMANQFITSETTINPWFLLTSSRRSYKSIIINT
jgi:hypothetical protein